MTTTITVVSFGYLHGDPPGEADLTIDVRRKLRDPVRVAGLLDLTGTDQAVVDAVLGTAGARPLILATTQAALALGENTDQPVFVAVGCAGGRHRSVVIADQIGRLLGALDWQVEVRHLDIHRPRVIR